MITSKQQSYLVHRGIAEFVPLMPEDGSFTHDLDMSEVIRRVASERGWQCSDSDLLRILSDSNAVFEHTAVQLASKDPGIERQQFVKSIVSRHLELANRFI